MLTKLNKKEKKKALAYIKKARKAIKDELNKEFILKKEKKFKNEVVTVLYLRHTYNVVIALLESEPTTVNINFAWVMRNHVDELTYRPR